MGWQNIVNFQIPQKIEGKKSPSKSSLGNPTALFCQALYHCKESLLMVKAASPKLVRSQIFILLQLAISMVVLQGIISKLCTACCLLL